MNTAQNQLVSWYGNGQDGSVPTPEQWARILERDEEKGITLINFFKFRESAHYDGRTTDISGSAAFDQYAAVSIPTMERVGGRFLLVAPFEASLIGADEDWDLIAIGAYPNQKAFLDLYSDQDYRSAFKHRSAACLRQKVLIAAGQ